MYLPHHEIPRNIHTYYIYIKRVKILGNQTIIHIKIVSIYYSKISIRYCNITTIISISYCNKKKWPAKRATFDRALLPYSENLNPPSYAILKSESDRITDSNKLLRSQFQLLATEVQIAAT